MDNEVLVDEGYLLELELLAERTESARPVWIALASALVVAALLWAFSAASAAISAGEVRSDSEVQMQPAGEAELIPDPRIGVREIGRADQESHLA